MESRREEWARRVGQWRRSGLTAKEYADSIGVKAGTLAYWAWRLGQAQRLVGKRSRRGSKSMPLAMIEVVPGDESMANGFELRVGNRYQLYVPARFDAQALKQLIAVLEGQA